MYLFKLLGFDFEIQYLFKCLGFDFEIQYCPSKSNMAVDALSQLNNPPTTATDFLMVFSIPHLDFLSDLKSSLQGNEEFITLRDQITTSPMISLFFP